LEIQKWNPEVIVEDYELFLRLCLLGEFAFDPEALSAYRIHATNMSKQTELIINGKIQALRLNAKNLGFNSKELEEIITKVNWESADFCLNSKQRVKAIKLTLQNSHVKIPITSKLKQYLKLLLPNAALDIVRKRIKPNNKWENIDIRQLIFEQANEPNKRRSPNY
jgi:hypothetical protein